VHAPVQLAAQGRAVEGAAVVARLENGGLVAGWLEVGGLEERLQVSAHDLHLADKVGVAAAAVCEGAHGRLTAVYLHLCEKVVFSGLFDMSFLVDVKEKK